MECKTIKVLPSSPEQGEFVIINEEDFNPQTMTKYSEEKSEETPRRRGRQPKDE